MKSGFGLVSLVSVIGMLLSGCLFKPVTDSTRHFVLAPISTNEPNTTSTQHLPVGIGFVKMPSYLLRDSIAIRDGANEIEYLERAMWGERLDLCFQRTLAANLSRLLPSDSVYLTDWGRDRVTLRVLINVQQFDVDTHGHGTLIAQWRIIGAGSDLPSESGQTQLARFGATPKNDPEIIATTLSELVVEFSRQLAQPIRKSARSGP
ncbi:MAG TPA: PqiC family protein [Candidatus Nitrosotalea sp.]|nr:PqiC family protein [Candidatus Nitrosotalea sp.]